ncbi:MAG: FAD-dependent oxidoreductase [Nitrososphaeria archaeon]|nr:FAD-dependent oxidoreductase [Nitrososphaeria archaeon]NIN52435.1 FAD-dependent oxidoreductase [Nitrososphaeria archaeon]NIQ32936.1 FAD-dependent oxidoreductase [Nitrososphaeria archaeon]
MTEFDVIIVGAGILGLSTAYHLKRENPKKKILLIDTLSAAGQANTAKSNACYRNFFSSEVNYTLADSSVNFYLHLQRDLGYDLGMRQTGYLFLMSERRLREVSKLIESMKKTGRECRIYEKEDLKRMLQMRTEVEIDEEARRMGLGNIEKGVFVVKAGHFHADALTNYYESEFKRIGGQTLYDTNVSRLIIEPSEKLGLPDEPRVWQEARISGVKTNRGEFFASKIVIAAGAWSSSLLDPVGIDAHVKPKKRQIFVVKAEKKSLSRLLNTKGFNEEGTSPITILPKPLIVTKPEKEENGFWISCSDELGRKFMLEEDPSAEEEYYNYDIYLVLRLYFPQFEGVRPFRSWAGQYAINTIDGVAYVFEEEGLMVVTGASGSGVMKADSIGRIASALYAEEKYAELFGDKDFRVSDLGVKERRVEPEQFVT